MTKTINVLFIGDIVGSAGRHMVGQYLKSLKAEHQIDLTIANMENSAGGFGVTASIYQELLNFGVTMGTSGNHIYDKKEIMGQLAHLPHLIRPINFPGEHPGKGYWIGTIKGVKVAVINAIGRVFMGLYDCPFRAVDKMVTEIREQTPIIIVDFHAEATSEKLAMGWFLSGKVSAVLGTHTHVATADEQLLDNRTAYISDVGMTGGKLGILGMERDAVMERFLRQIPNRFEADKGPEKILSAVKVSIDCTTGHAKEIIRIKVETPVL